MNETDQNQEVVLDTRPKPFVFVLMPFADEFTDPYELGIKPACERAGAYAERLDEQMFKESMLQRIYNQIAKADVIVADMTGRNPNVFYEVGYAHALGKVVILLTQKNEDIPFDLKHYRHIVYENVSGLLPQLETAVGWAIEQASEKRQPKLPLEIYCNDILLVDTPTIDCRFETARTGVPLCITCANSDELDVVECRMALWTSDRCTGCEWPLARQNSISIRRPGGVIFNAPGVMSLLPGEWESVRAVIFMKQEGEPQPNLAESITLRISTKSGSYSYPFILKIELSEKR